MQRIQGPDSFRDRRRSGFEELPDLLVGRRDGKPDLDVGESLQDVDVPQDEGRFGLEGFRA
ncbi:MAG TPA: hypothetical protein PLQ15_08390 [Syntrophales bacterium]|nr:hypothetical protein [Syntrophales bacterium]